MKKLFLLVIMVLSFTMIFAQSNKVQSAFSYFRAGRIDKAKVNIDDAILNESTMKDAKTWCYRGAIYVRIASDSNFQKLDPNAVQIAYEAYNKSIELDAEKEFEDKNRIGLMECAYQFFERGVSLFTAKDYTNALTAFDKAIKINTSFGVKDTLSTFNALLTAEQLQNKPKIKEYCQSLIRSGFYQPSIYVTLSEVYKDENDTIKAIKTVENGLKKYPDNLELIIANANIYLYIGDPQKSQKALNLAIEKDPKNPTIHFAVGTNYDKAGDVENAEKSYLKAIEFKPDYFDAFYNLGALYVNDAVAIMAKANKLALNDKNYDVLKKQADAQLNKALPYLEKSLEMQPNEKVVLLTLKDIYSRLNNLPKLKEINQKLTNFK